MPAFFGPLVSDVRAQIRAEAAAGAKAAVMPWLILALALSALALLKGK